MSEKSAPISNIISFEVFQKKRQERDKQNMIVKGTLVWLYCPNCRTLEYTSVVAPGGRTHKKCGTQVQEREFDLDLRGEYTICLMNIETCKEIIGSIKSTIGNSEKKSDLEEPIQEFDEPMQDLEEHMIEMVKVEEAFISKLKEAAKDRELEPYVPGHPNLTALIEQASKDDLGIMRSLFRINRDAIKINGADV